MFYADSFLPNDQRVMITQLLAQLNSKTSVADSLKALFETVSILGKT